MSHRFWSYIVNIQPLSGRSDRTTRAILNLLSGAPISTLSEYSMSVRLIRLQHRVNIECAVSLTLEYTKSIINYCPTNPIAALFNIERGVRPTDEYTKSIFS